LGFWVFGAILAHCSSLRFSIAHNVAVGLQWQQRYSCFWRSVPVGRQWQQQQQDNAEKYLESEGLCSREGQCQSMWVWKERLLDPLR
jgi:hypothetical protein